MPSLSFCGRQWALASDDLPALAFFGALFHGAWLLLLIVFSIIAVSLRQPKDCEEVAVFMSCLLLSTLVSTIADVLVIRNGVRGYILQPSSRRYVEIVMYVLTGNLLMKIGIIGYGTYLIFLQQPQCLKDTPQLDKLMQAVTISTWVIVSIYIGLFIASYQAFPMNSVLQWKRRIRCVNWCCCGGFDQNESESLARMALVFERFFNPTDFSVTDTLVSIILAAKRQSFLRHQAQSDFEPVPDYMASLGSTALNGIQLMDRRLGEGLQHPQQIEMQPTKLSTVTEDVEMDMLEQGMMNGDWESVPTEGTSDGRLVISPTPIELEMLNEPHDLEVAQIAPRHRRTPAVDFSQLNLDSLRQAAEEEQRRNGEGSDYAHHSSISSPDTLSHADSVPSSSDPPPDASSSLPIELKDLSGELDDDAEGSEGSVSGDTMLSWGDDFTGPVLIPSSQSLVDFSLNSPTVDYDTLEKMHLYHRYALASYGALLYMASGKRFRDVCGRCAGLCLHAAPPASIHTFTVTGSHTSQSPYSNSQRSSLRQRLNEEAVLRYGFKKENILYWSHEDVLAGHLPYFVALDYDDEAVVVAVRGTWSWSDLVTDFLIHPEPLSVEETTEVNQLLAELRGFDRSRASCLPDVSVHSGMLRSARGLIRNMQTVGMLEFLETGSCQLAATNVGMALPNMEKWKFVMTGHSLGAGVVTLATLLLKSRFPQRKIECYAVSPPGCVMSPELATAMSHFCYSLVHGKDIVPRISVRTVERLRDQMVRAATLCRRSKLAVLLSGLFKSKWKEEDLFFNPEQVDAEPLEAFRKYRAAVRSAKVEDFSVAREFIPPGRIVFLRPTKRKPNSSSSTSAPLRDFEAVWISGRDLMKEGILLSLFMIKDHFPYFSIESLRDVMDRRGEF